MKWLIWIKCLVAAPTLSSFQVSDLIESNRSGSQLKNLLAKQLDSNRGMYNLFITYSYQFHFLLKHLINLFLYIDIEEEQWNFSCTVDHSILLSFVNLNLNFRIHFYTWKTVVYLLQILRIRAIQWIITQVTHFQILHSYCFRYTKRVYL